MPRFCLALMTLLAVAACAPFPEIDAVGPETGPPPALLPIDDLLSAVQTTSTNPGPALIDRATRLKARAAALQAPPPPGG